MLRRFCCVLAIAAFLAFPASPVVLRAEDEVAKPVDRYAVPEGDVGAIFEFIKGLEAYRPTTTDEVLAYRQNARKALATAADRIIKAEQDKTSDAYRKASAIQLQLGLAEVQNGTAETQRDVYQKVLAHLKSAKSASQQDLALAYTFGQVLEQVGNVDLAKEAYGEFGKFFSTSDDPSLAGYEKR